MTRVFEAVPAFEMPAASAPRARRRPPVATARLARAACLPVLAALAVIGASAGDARAQTACGHRATISTPGANRVTMICLTWCVVQSSGDTVRLGALTLEGPTGMVDCMHRCRDTPGCRSVSITDYVEMRDGRPVVVRLCTLYGAGPLTTAGARASDRRPGANYYVCYMKPEVPSESYQLDTDRFQQDQGRPGAPIPRGK